MRLGIDFGTTRTVVAVAHKGNYPLVGFEAEAGERQEYCPSLLALRPDGQVLAGWGAQAAAHDEGVVLCKTLKRELGGVGATPARALEIGEVSQGLGQWLVKCLEQLKAELLKGLPRRLKKGEPLEVVVATPVRATSAYRLMLADAMREVGFEVLGMVHEPAAAAVEYAARWADTLNSKRERVVVYDLGGGTFDVASVELTAQTYLVTGYDGRGDIGGEDFDRVLMELALDELGVEASALSARSVSLIQEHCRQQKEGLHANSRQVIVSVGGELDEAERQRLGLDVDSMAVLKVADYYEACLPLVEQTLEVMRRVVPWSEEGGFDLDGIAGVYVVGGASSLPVVWRALKESFGRRLHRSSYPSSSAAVGLAMLAQELGDAPAVKLQDQLGRYFGVYRELEGGERIVFDALLEPQVSLPGLGQAPIEVVRRYRPRHNIGRFRYLECSHVDERAEPSGHVAPLPEVSFAFSRELRELEWSALKVERLEEPGPVIEERYRVHADGVIEVWIGDAEVEYWSQHRLR